MWRRRSAMEAGERRRKAPVRGGKISVSRRRLSTLAYEHMEQWRREQGHERTVTFGHDVPVLAAASPASASAMEGSWMMGRGWWRGAAVVGEL